MSTNPLTGTAAGIVAEVESKYTERQRILEIVRNNIGRTALEEITEDNQLSVFRELLENIESEVSGR
jgi:hypothetical protein